MTDLAGYIPETCVRCGVPAANWEEAIRQVGSLLQKASYLEESYIERCIETVKEQGPYMVIAKGIALAHARPGSDVKQEAIGVISLQNPVNFGSKDNDPVKLVFLLAALNDNSHIEALMVLAQKLSEGDVRERILQITDSQKLYEALVK